MDPAERVLVIPATDYVVDWLGGRQGFTPTPVRLPAFLVGGTVTFRRRGLCEEDPRWKQLIPYAVLRRGGQVFCYRRDGGGDRRLESRWSLGVGGHVNPDDLAGLPHEWSLLPVLEAACGREVDEELVLEGAGWQIHWAGFVNDDADAVGLVHLGIVFVIELEPGVEVTPRSPGVECRWLDPAALADHDGFEGWSRILARDFLGSSQSSQPAIST